MAKDDEGHKETEALISEVEGKVSSVYTQASTELEQKLDDYFRRFEAKDKTKQEQVRAGELSASEYATWRQNQMLVGQRWEELRGNISIDLHNSNAIARSIVDEYTPEAYATNFNYGTYQVEQLSGVDTSFTLYDRHAVERIIKNDPEILPQPGKQMNQTFAEFDAYKAGQAVKISPTKQAAFDRYISQNRDIRWQSGQIQSVATQALLQGESIPHVAQRIANTMGEMNRKQSTRYARTAMTGAQNAGRSDAYQRAKDMGIGVKNQWMAIHDNRTRDSHRAQDGEIRDVGEKFSNGCAYPGDISARPEEFWNCRCTMRPVLTKYSFSTDLTPAGDIEGQSYEDWKAGRKGKNKG